jgi:hypothetical protein
MPTIRP